MNRRDFLKTGLMGVAAVATGTSLYGCSDLDILDTKLIDDEAKSALIALIPVFLNGALPEDDAQRQLKIGQTIEGMTIAMKRLPPRILDELKDLFGLLSNRLANLAIAGNFAYMAELTTTQRTLFIEGLRNSYLSLLNNAYDGLKELVFAGFYGNPKNWGILDYNKPDLGA